MSGFVDGQPRRIAIDKCVVLRSLKTCRIVGEGQKILESDADDWRSSRGKLASRRVGINFEDRLLLLLTSSAITEGYC